MDTLNAFIMGEMNRNNPIKVFDWEKAARLIVEHKATHASAGLCGDWEYTGGSIFANGKPVPEDDTYVYLASTWATPEIEIDGERMDCYKMQKDTPNWDANTYWPEVALKIIGAEHV